MPKSKKQLELEQEIGELTSDLQRVRADFENYRKRVDHEKLAAVANGEMRAVLKLLPVIDTIERATKHVPVELKNDKWALGVIGLTKQLDKMLGDLKITRVNSEPGTVFDPSVHEAIQFDEESEGEKEVIAEELQPGYKMDGTIIRHAMVRVTRK